jgi:predicted GNAT family acetyltransferase
MTLRVARFDDVTEFLDAVGPYLAAREAEHSLLFGILDSLSRDPSVSDGPPFLAAVRDRDRLVGVTLRTPPHHLVLSEMDDLDATGAIVGDRIAAGDTISSAIGPVNVVRAFADRWTAATGRPHRRQMSERAFRLSRVIAPRPVPGSMRLAAGRDRDLLIDWLLAFEHEALPERERDSRADAEESVARWLDKGTKRAYLWETDDEVVSWTSVGGRTPNGTRIGPVYTPPRHRGHGYASAVVAAASQAQLDEGLAFCFLFTDLANPTSNRIYQSIGYEPVTDIDVYAFD